MSLSCNQPVVSIIIPCYNYEKYIKKCIDSALDQTYENVEIIVIDNGSTDNSLLIINEFSDNEKVRILNFSINIPPGKNNSVIGQAINIAKGEYISILYADDWYLNKKIEKQVNLFNKSPSSVGVIYCHGYHYFESIGKMEKWCMGVKRGYIFKEYLTSGDIVIPISPLVKKYCYEIIGTKNDWTGSEYDFFLMSQYVDFDYVDDFLVVMREHDKNDGKNILSVYDRVQRYNAQALYNKNTIDRVGRKLINKRVANNYLIFSLNFIASNDFKMSKDAIIKAILIMPQYVLKFRVIIVLILSFLPARVSAKIYPKVK
jgi:alpha-1,3-rhamnosyltransferase